MPDIVVITTNRSPWDWYNYNDRDYEREALFRRITGGTYMFRKSIRGVPEPISVDIWDQKNFERPNPAIMRYSDIQPYCDNVVTID